MEPQLWHWLENNVQFLCENSPGGLKDVSSLLSSLREIGQVDDFLLKSAHIFTHKHNTKRRKKRIFHSPYWDDETPSPPLPTPSTPFVARTLADRPTRLDVDNTLESKIHYIYYRWLSESAMSHRIPSPIRHPTFFNYLRASVFIFHWTCKTKFSSISSYYVENYWTLLYRVFSSQKGDPLLLTSLLSWSLSLVSIFFFVNFLVRALKVSFIWEVISIGISKRG